MARITQISPEAATGRAKELLDAVKGKLGLVPNMTRAMANAPAVLDGYLQLSGALGKGTCRPRSASRSPSRSPRRTGATTAWPRTRPSAGWSG